MAGRVSFGKRFELALIYRALAKKAMTGEQASLLVRRVTKKQPLRYFFFFPTPGLKRKISGIAQMTNIIIA